MRKIQALNFLLLCFLFSIGQAFGQTVYSNCHPDDLHTLNDILRHQRLWDVETTLPWSIDLSKKTFTTSEKDLSIVWNADTPKRIIKIYLERKGLGGTISLEKLDKLQNINLNSNNIEWLKLGKLPSLKEIYCRYNKLKTIEIEQLGTSLEILNLYSNKLTDLSVDHLEGLKKLDVDDNKLEVLAISDLSKLQEIKCQDNSLIGLSLKNLPALQELRCEDNQIDFEQIVTLKGRFSIDSYSSLLPQKEISSILEKIWKKGDIIDLKHIAGFNEFPEKYEWLDYDEEELEVHSLDDPKPDAAIEEIAKGKFRFLKGGEFYCRLYPNKERYSNYIQLNLIQVKEHFADLHPEDLQVLIQLLEIQKRSTATEIKPLPWKIDIEESSLITTDGNETIEWNNESPRRLIKLSVNRRSLLYGKIDLRKLKKLKHLNISRNVYDDLDIRGLDQLEYLDCSYSDLKHLLMNGVTQLEFLDCSNNSKLKEIDVSALLKLKRLLCDNNDLSNLKLNPETKLEQIECDDNRFAIEIIERLYTSQKEGLILDSYIKGSNFLPQESLDLQDKEEWKIGEQIDLSHYLELEGGDVDYVWINSDGTEVIVDSKGQPKANASLRKMGDGVFAFKKGGIFKCRAQNISFNSAFSHQYFETSPYYVEKIVRAHPEDLAFLQSILELSQAEYFDEIDWEIDLASNTFHSNYQWSLVEWNEEIPARLTRVWIFGKGLKGELRIPDLPALKDIRISSNQLTSLIIEGGPQLNMLLCAYNSISKLELNNVPNLDYIDCSHNELSLDDVLSLQDKHHFSRQVIHNKLIPQKNVKLLSKTVWTKGEEIDFSPWKEIRGESGKFSWWSYDDFTAKELLVDTEQNPNPKAYLRKLSEAKFRIKKGGNYWCRVTVPYLTNIFQSERYIESEPYIVSEVVKADKQELQVLQQILEQSKATGDRILPWKVDLTKGEFSTIDGWSTVQWNDAVPKRLTKLNISNRAISGSLDFSTFTELNRLDCMNNQLTAIEVNQLKKLTDLKCDSNQLKELNVGGLNQLSYFSCTRNMLTELDCNSLKQLKTLYCEYNELHTLKIDLLKDLKTIYSSNNRLDFLNLFTKSYYTYTGFQHNTLPQKKIKFLGEHTIKPNTRVDLSNQKSFYDFESTYIWVNEAGSEVLVDTESSPQIEAPIRKVETGKFIFKKEGNFYCRIKNPAHPLSSYNQPGQNYIESELFIVSNREVPTLDFSTLSESSYGDTPLILSAQTNSDGILSFELVGESFGNEIQGNKLIIRSVGQITLRAFVNKTERYASLSLDQMVHIKPKKLTITPNSDQGKQPGEVEPVLEYTRDGLLEGDQLIGSLSREAGEAIGSYAIQIGSLSAGNNYSITLDNEVFIIAKLPVPDLTVTVNPSAIYGDSPLTIEVLSNSKGTVSMQLKNATEGTKLSGSTVTLGDAGEFELEVMIAETEEHAEAKTIKTIVIEPKELTITPNSDQGKQPGEVEPVLEYTMDGLLEGDQLIGSLSREAGEAIGSYAIQIGSLSAGSNYMIRFVQEVFKIENLLQVNYNRVSICPNPVLNQLNLSNLLQGSTIELLNLNGTTAKQAKAIMSTHTLDCSGLPNGIYLLRVDDIVLQKIIKQ